MREQSTTLKSYKTHLMILNQWKAKKSVEESVNLLDERFGKRSFNFPRVSGWFKEFNKGNTSIPKDSILDVWIKGDSSVGKDPLNYIFCVTMNGYGSDLDGRFSSIMSFCCSTEKRFIDIYDCFYDEEK